MAPAPVSPPGAVWPLVGRSEELAYLRQARHSETPAVVIGGAQGVGKTRLAVEALAEARTERWTTERVDGATATASVPFGAVAHLATPDAAQGGDPLRLLLSAAEGLTERAARRPLMLLVDDAHYLDEASLALLRRLLGAPSPRLFLLLTVRSDEHVPAPVVGLWKDGHADRIELQPLSRDESHHLVSRVLAGTAEPATFRWLWDHSLGNPLFLRELVLAGQEHGSHDRSHDHRPGTRLVEVVRSRLGDLDDQQRTALELLVVGGPLPRAVLTALVPSTTLVALAARGLLAEREEAGDVTVTLAHPVYGIVLSEQLTTGRARELRGHLLDLLDTREVGEVAEPREIVRLATLRLDQGQVLDPPQLLVAARYAQAAFPRALAEQAQLTVGSPPLDQVTAAVAAGVDTEPATRPSHDDLAVAERLARAAWAADRSLTPGLVLTTILVARGRTGEAATLADELSAQAHTDEQRAQVALVQAALRFWAQGRADDAVEILLAAEASTDDGRALARLARLRAGIALNVGRVGEAVTLASELVATAESAGSPDQAAMAAATAAAGLALGGRAQEATDLVDRFVPVALHHAREIPEALGQLLLARIMAARVLGHLDEAERLGYACYQPAAEQASLAGMAVFTGVLGQVALDRGQPVSAARRLREAEVLLREYDTFGYRPYVLACLAMALAQSGHSVTAQEASDLARASLTQTRFFAPELVTAQAWCDAVAGRHADAVAAATSAADQARDAGLHAFELTARHALVRLGQAEPAVDPLVRLASTIGGPLVAAYAEHAAASASGRGKGDGGGLDGVSLQFEELGALLLAAEASAQASAAHDAAGQAQAARQSGARAQHLAAACEGAWTPALLLAVRTPGLTAREREVAILAADGLTSKAIAERLYVSSRTVESHLYRIFAKLGVDDRHQLADVLHPGTSPGSGK